MTRVADMLCEIFVVSVLIMPCCWLYGSVLSCCPQLKTRCVQYWCECMCAAWQHTCTGTRGVGIERRGTLGNWITMAVVMAGISSQVCTLSLLSPFETPCLNHPLSNLFVLLVCEAK